LTQHSSFAVIVHPDKNGGERSFETKLQKAVDAYAALKTIK
jgi:DnaJ-class molecular chaperone